MEREIKLSAKPTVFESINEFSGKFAADLPSGIIQINTPKPIILSWSNRKSETTLVTFSAAITRRAAETVPVFSGWGTTKHLSSNVLMISDPTLVIDQLLTLGWYSGSVYNDHCQTEISEVLGIFAGLYRLVLFGASGGGYAALLQTLQLPSTKFPITALVSNPQTDIRKFSYYPDYLDIAWRGASSDELPITQELVSLNPQAPDNRIVYIQNSQDTHHVTEHFNPFRENCGLEKSIYLTPDLGDGHIGPDAGSFKDLFSIVTEVGSWQDLTENLLDYKIYSTKTR